MAKVPPGGIYATRAMTRGTRVCDPASLAEECCWPGCGDDLAEPMAGPPLCVKHILRCATWVKDNLAASMRAAADRAPKSDLDKRRQILREQSQVYYLRIGDHVKIGVTGNLKERLHQLRVDPDALLAAEPGGPELERERHLEFAAERIGRRENFNPSRRLLDHIAKVREAHGEPIMTTWPKYHDWHEAS